MHRACVPTLLALSACAFLLPAAPAHAQLNALPRLGTPVPAQLLTGDKKEKHCRTADTHIDPCADVSIGDIRYTIAWDASTKDITWLFTDDRHVVTDNGLAVGSSIRVMQDSGQADPTVPYMKWFLDPRWKDTDAKLGSAVWYAALHKDYDHHFGDIAGFVQSTYLPLKP